MNKLPDFTGVNKHDQIIGALAPRSWLAEGTSLLDNVWVIDTSRKGQERCKKETIRFDIPIQGWPKPITLDDPEFTNDLITAKLLVYLSLEPKPVGWLTTASSVAPFHRRHLNFIRWKHEWGIKENRNIRAAHVRHFERCIRKPGLNELLRVESKAKRLVEAFENGELAIPFQERGFFFHAGIEALLGLSLNQTPVEAILVLQEFARRRGLQFQRAVRTGSGGETREKRRTSASALMSPFYHLSRLRDFLDHDPIGYDAFNSPKELSDALKGWTEETKRTADCPPYQTSWLIHAALKLLLSDLPETIIDVCLEAATSRGAPKNIEDIDRLNERLIEKGFKRVDYLFRRDRWKTKETTGITLRELLFLILAGACAIVIAAYSGRRDGEVMALQRGCIQVDEFGEAWLQCWISKKQRYTTKLPANSSTKRAVRVLETIQERTSWHHDTNWLFEFFDAANGRVKFKLNDALEAFSRWCDVPAMPDGSHWQYAAHQMRKFFAVNHQWRYFFPELMVLNHQLQQRDKNVTAAYTRMEAGNALKLHDERQAKLKQHAALLWSAEDRVSALREEEHSMVRYICQQALSGKLLLKGPGGKNLYNDLLGIVESQLHVTSEETSDMTFNQPLDDFYRSLTMQVHPEGHSICKCGGSAHDKSTAGCLRLKELDTGAAPEGEPGPDYSYAVDEVCASCPQNIRLSALMPYWAGAVDEAMSALASSSHSVRDVAKERVAFLEEVIEELRFEN